MPRAGRFWDDDDVSPVPRSADWRPDPPRLEALARRPPPLTAPQRSCYEALALALEEGQVFAAVTGPEGSGKSTVLRAVLDDRRSRDLRCLRIDNADKIPARLAAQIEQVASAEAAKPDKQEHHVVLAIDDAHAASDELLQCLARLAAMREPGRRVPQLLLVGRPELWNRLAAEEFAPLAKRVAVRAVLPPLQREPDPWEQVEQELSQTITQAAEPAELPPVIEAPEFRFERGVTAPADPAGIAPAGLPRDPESIPPPTDFALFPDPPPVAAARQNRREGRLRLWLPLACLALTVVAFGVLLTFYDWPDLLGDVPLADPKPATQFVFPPPQNRVAAAPPHPAAIPNPAPPARPPATALVAPPSPAPAPGAAQEPSPPRVAAPEPAPAAKPAPEPVVVAHAAPDAAPRPTPASPAPELAPAVVTLLLRRGEEAFAIGDVSAARLLFERAAEAGNAKAAYRLGRTFDPAVLNAADAATLGDRRMAQTWYSRAAALGDKEAAERLREASRDR